MSEDNEIPFAPAKFHSRSDEEFAVAKPKASRQEKKSSKCFVYTLAGIVLVSASILVFALVVMRPRTPRVQLSLVTVRNLHYNSSSPSFNMTLVVELTIKNTNFGPFKYENTTASVLYGRMNVGEKKLGSGRVRGRDSEGFNIMVDIRSYGLPDTKNLSNEINSGILKLSSHAKLSGKVHLIQIVKKKRIAVMNCTMSLHLTNRSIENLVCN